MGTRRNGAFIAAGAAACLLYTGCASYSQQTQNLRAAWTAADYATAAAAAQKGLAANDNNVNRLVWQLETATTYRAAQNYDESETYFGLADDAMRDWDDKPGTLLGYETSAILVNQTNLPYRGTTYDRVMLGTYRALNALQRGDAEAARVQLNRVYQRQTEAVERFNAEIASFKNDMTATNSRTLKCANADAKFSKQIAAGESDLRVNAGYAPFVNPFSVWLDGVFFLYRSTGAADTERALKSLERVAQMTGESGLVAADIARAKQIDPPAPAVVYVVLETGVAPWRDEWRIDVPTYFISKDVPYTGVALPKLDYHPQIEATKGFSVKTSDGAAVSAAALCDMDAVVSAEFKKVFPSILAKTLVSAATKASLQYGLQTATKDAGTAGAIIQIAGILYQVAVNNADLRVWSTLPQFIYAARLDMPQNRALVVEAQGLAPVSVPLIDGKVVVVYLKNVRGGQPPQISQFVLVP